MLIMTLLNKQVLNKGVYVLISLFVLLVSCGEKQDQLTQLNKESSNNEIQKRYVEGLAQCQLFLDELSQSVSRAAFEKNYLKSREVFKRIEPIMAFHDIENYKFFNAPNILKVEEEDLTDIKIINPKSFQVLEESIFTTDSLDHEKISETARLLKNRLALLEKNSDLSYLKDYHFLWMVRNGFVRVALTGITGFDSPVLENSLSEAATVYTILAEIIQMKKDNFNDQSLYEEFLNEIISCTSELSQGDFKKFDRYSFIKNHTQKQLALFNRTALDWGVEFPFAMALNNDVISLFSDKTFNDDFFADRNSGSITKQKSELGKELFNDTDLSKSGSVSCASCHQSDLAFTDGKIKSDGQTRNSPTLTYAALQQDYFYDRRAGSLEGQIVSVVENETEFHSDLELLSEAVERNEAYKQQFKKAYRDSITDFNIRNAIANYIRSLNKFNSKFDNNINGLENTLSQSEINGFNLFMGKAKCATCHFAPLFNGTVPPNYTETEIELLGVPISNDTVNAVVDTDLGVYNIFGTEERKFFFKTPSIRNIEKTGPYMHNGVYTTLEEVLDFYNRGGGAGIGIDLEYQTLPPDELNLSAEEQSDIIYFMKTLSDTEDVDSMKKEIAVL